MMTSARNFLEAQNFRVLRFWNDIVSEELKP